ncbi:hypothetical protein JCM10908_002974 [Rhodotorula pacifica]|uniref:uncharacterized protein n=1 Tax=Rhodotorula pacifica TaxID=1495444 RepID=UPI00317FCF57
MLVTCFALLAAALAGPVTASLSLGHDGSISSINAHHKIKDYGEVSLKEICYRNLYADLAAFKVKNTKEALITDSKHQTVFVSQGTLRDENNVELLYEEYCYKQYKVNSHNSDVDAVSGIQVGKRDLISTLGLSSLDGLGGFSPSGANGGQKGNSDPSSLFSKGSFLDTFSTYSPTGDDGFFAGSGVDSLDSDSLDKDGVAPQNTNHGVEADKTGAGGESPKLDDHTAHEQPEVSYSTGQGKAETPDGKGKRASAWRRFVMRSEKNAST